MSHEGTVVAVFGNMVTATVDRFAMLGSMAYCRREDQVGLLSEVIRIRGGHVDLQVFEDTRGLKIGDAVEYTSQLIQVTLGPGLLGQVYDGLQNPLPQLAKKTGIHMEPGNYLPALDENKIWDFSPVAKKGDSLVSGQTLGIVQEGIFSHRIMMPFFLKGPHVLEKIVLKSNYKITEQIAVLKGPAGRLHSVTMQQKWPVKIPLCQCKERLLPTDPLVTKVRIIDTMFPIVKGGTYCIPGPFGAGKTVLQHITSRHAEIDVVVVAACGERAGEVVELLQEFPQLKDPRTGRSLMERTIIICNTSSMPVAAREASVYTAVTLAEYYRQMGLNVIMLADSTTRWAQALRELSGRLEEIPGEEAFPAYLESRIANLYERAGAIKLKDNSIGSVTIGGTVSPAGGSFEEPVTQGTLKVVGAFHGLSRARSDARRFPAIDPLDSWSTYPGIIEPKKRAEAETFLREGNEIKQMMTVVGEEGTSIEDFTIMLKAEFFDEVYLQQNAFDEVDAASSASRQKLVFEKVLTLLRQDFVFENREQARDTIFRARDLFKHWNYLPMESEEFIKTHEEINIFIDKKGQI